MCIDQEAQIRGASAEKSTSREHIARSVFMADWHCIPAQPSVGPMQQNANLVRDTLLQGSGVRSLYQTLFVERMLKSCAVQSAPLFRYGRY